MAADLKPVKWWVRIPPGVPKLDDKTRGFQIMARCMLLRPDWGPLLEEGQYERVGGDAECKICRLAYFEHPQLPGLPTFHMTCEFKIVKT